MRNLLTQHGIPSENLRDAVEFLNTADSEVIGGFIREFKLNLSGSDALSAARFAADAIIRNAASVDKVVAHVSKMMTGGALRKAPQPVTIIGVPVVETETVTIVAVEPKTATPAIVVKGRRGRRRLGNSDFCKAVVAIEAAPKDAGREGILDCIIAGGIKRSSAVVYLWRYNNGERE